MTNTLTVAFAKGDSRLIPLLHLFDQASLDLVDLQIKKPSLNDVFLEITGKQGVEG